MEHAAWAAGGPRRRSGPLDRWAGCRGAADGLGAEAEPPTPAAMRQLPPIPADHARQLAEVGYVVVPRMFSADVLQSAEEAVKRLLAEEGDAAGSEFRQEAGVARLAALVGKDEIFERLLCDTAVLSYVAHVFGGADHVKISSINARVVPPGGDAGLQPLHSDFSAVRDEAGPWVCNVLVALDPYNHVTGPLRAVPGSHRFGRLPAADMADPTAPHPHEAMIEAERGDAIVMDAHTWHSGTAHAGEEPKGAVHLFWCRRDKPQQQHQSKLIPPAAQSAMPELPRWLCALGSAENERLMAEQGTSVVSGAIAPAAAKGVARL